MKFFRLKGAGCWAWLTCNDLVPRKKHLGILRILRNVWPFQRKANSTWSNRSFFLYFVRSRSRWGLHCGVILKSTQTHWQWVNCRELPQFLCFFLISGIHLSSSSRPLTSAPAPSPEPGVARVAFKKVELCCFNPHLRCSQTLEIYRDWYRSWVLNQEYFATLIWRCWCCSMVCSLGMFGEIEILFVRFILPTRNDASCTAWNIVRPFKLKLTLHVEMTLLAGLLVIYNSVCMLWFEFTYVDQFINDIECWHIMLLMCRTNTSKIWTAEISWGQVWLTWGCQSNACTLNLENGLVPGSPHSLNDEHSLTFLWFIPYCWPCSTGLPFSFSFPWTKPSIVQDAPEPSI